MNKGFSSFAKGMGTGMVAGIAVVATGSAILNNNKAAKKKVGHAVKTVSDIVENVSYILK